MDINRNNYRWVLGLGSWLAIAVIAIGCASTDQQGGYDNYDYGDDDYGDQEGGEEVNNAESNEYGDEEGGDYSSNYDNGEGVNNNSYNEFEDSNQLALNEGEGDAYGNELALDNEYATENDSYGEYTNNAEETDDLLAENSGLNLSNNDTYDAYGADTGDVAPVNAAVDTPMMDAPINTAATPMPSGGGIVKFIREATSFFDQPNGTSLSAAMVGDHPVVWENGEFHRDSKGRYIPSSALSTSPIGRPRSGGSWRSSGGGGY